MFLYYAIEDPHFKISAVFRDHPPCGHSDGVLLQYQLCPCRDWAIPMRCSSAHAFLVALKTLHDFPSIDRNTDFGGPIFPVELQGTENVIRINKRNIPPPEVPNFWSAASQSIRLAAYYEVNATLIEPDRPALLSGRVLRYGIRFLSMVRPIGTSRRRHISSAGERRIDR